MATHTTLKRSAVYRKIGGSVQAYIAAGVQITVVETIGDYARFTDPLVLSSDDANRQWIAQADIQPIDGTTPPPADNWPAYYILEDADGNRQRYNKQ